MSPLSLTFAPSNLVVVSVVSGTTYTFALADLDKLKSCTSATAVVLTVPPNSTVAFPIGSVLEYGRYGAGSVTVAPGAGVTIRSLGGSLVLAGQYARGALHKIGTNEWWLVGMLG